MYIFWHEKQEAATKPRFSFPFIKFMGRLDVENKSSNCDDIPWQVMKWGNVLCEMNVRLFACEIIAC